MQDAWDCFEDAFSRQGEICHVDLRVGILLFADVSAIVGVLRNHEVDHIDS